MFSASNKRVSVQLVGRNKVEEKLKHFDELTSAAVSYLGVSSIGNADEIKSLVPSEFFFYFLEMVGICSISDVLSVADLKELHLTGNLLSKWEVSF